MPWSRSSSVPCAPSKRMRFPSRNAESTRSDVSDDQRPQPLRVSLVLLDEPLELDRLLAVDALEPEVLLGERDFDLLAQDLRVEDVLDADPEPHRLVGVAGPDAALRRADRELAEAPLARLVDREVPRHDQVRVAGEPDEVGRDAARAEVVELLDQHLGGRRRTRRRSRTPCPGGSPTGCASACTSRRRPRCVWPAFGPPL